MGRMLPSLIGDGGETLLAADVAGPDTQVTPDLPLNPKQRVATLRI